MCGDVEVVINIRVNLVSDLYILSKKIVALVQLPHEGN